MPSPPPRSAAAAAAADDEDSNVAKPEQQEVDKFVDDLVGVLGFTSAMPTGGSGGGSDGSGGGGSGGASPVVGLSAAYSLRRGLGNALFKKDAADLFDENDEEYLREREAWSTPPLPKLRWDLYQDAFVTTDSIDNVEKPGGTHGNLTLDDDVVRATTLELRSYYVKYYQLMFMSTDHVHYLHPRRDNDGDGDGPDIGPVLITVDTHRTSGRTKALVRTKKADTRLLVPAGVSAKERLRHVRAAMPELANAKFAEVRDNLALNKALSRFEDQSIVSHYKFGVIQWKDGQGEDEAFQNCEPCGAAFDSFLALLGEKIELNGWSRYRGGLDVAGGTTGQYSVFATYDAATCAGDAPIEIMFHVAPLLPYFEKDTQQVERKRHIGNDIVNVVFVDHPTAPFPVHIITSHYTYVFIVVRPAPHGGVSGAARRYRVSVVAKAGVRPFGPPLPEPPIFDATTLRTWLLTKLINAERAAMFAPTFSNKMRRTRNEVLLSLVKEYR